MTVTLHREVQNNGLVAPKNKPMANRALHPGNGVRLFLPGLAAPGSFFYLSGSESSPGNRV